MVVGILRLSLSIPDAGSLKGKRHVLRKVIDRVRARFNVAVAETGDNDLWQRAEIGIAAVGNDRRHVNEVLDKVAAFVEDMYVAPVLDRAMEIQTVGELGISPLSPPGGEGQGEGSPLSPSPPGGEGQGEGSPLSPAGGEGQGEGGME